MKESTGLYILGAVFLVVATQPTVFAWPLLVAMISSTAMLAFGYGIYLTTKNQ